MTREEVEKRIVLHVRDAIMETPKFDDAEVSVSGAELVEWFAAWRGNARDLLDVLDGKIDVGNMSALDDTLWKADVPQDGGRE